ncbi:MAG: histidinol dehydrogenase [Pseudomonadota bacterium]
MKILHRSSPTFDRHVADLFARKCQFDDAVETSCARIINEVKEDGDQALHRLTLIHDRIDLKLVPQRFDGQTIKDAARALDRKTLDALYIAYDRIKAFHLRQKPDDDLFTDEYGNQLGLRWRAIASVGLYVPGGTASYPSSVLMNAVPAEVAGVGRIAMTVPTPDGRIDPLVLAAAHLCGIDEIYRIGGAQAIAALAFGTQSIKPVDKITGPGNAWVAAAKKQVFGQVGIDMIAGPSEILIVADGLNDPDVIAIDLLSQAEHDHDARAILITDDAAFADRVQQQLQLQLAQLDRRAIAAKSLEGQGAIIIVEAFAEAVDLIDLIAPEHLELAIEGAEAFAQKITNAGAIFVGRSTPEAIGDYIAGPNHVLPTARAARYASGLGVHDFMKRTTVTSCSQEGLRAIGPDAIVLAKAEGLGAHARSIEARLEKLNR